jgi:pectin methylesterase-like acyl-CoA thioesterase
MNRREVVETSNLRRRPRRRARRRMVIAETLELRWLLSTIPLPSIPNRTFNITTYGASTASSDNTTSIQNTINAVSAAGGGTVEVPAGTFLSGPLTLANSINLQIDTGATLKMLPYGTYPLPNGATSYAHFIFANSLHDIEVSGGGTIDGQGSAWWTAQNAGQITVRRPTMIQVQSSSTVLVTGITMINPPAGHLAFSFINTNVTVDGITINTPNGTPNTDGIDCTGNHVLIENSSISDGDDNIAFGGRGGGDYTVTNCTFGTGHGLSIGSYTDSGGMNGLTVTNCYFNGTLSGPHGKSYRDRGGVVQNLSYSNLVMTGVTYPFNFDDYYTSPHPTDPSTDPGQAVTSTTPYWNNVSFTNIYSSGATYPVYMWGLPEAPLSNFTFNGVTSLGGTTKGNIYHATGVSITNSTFSPTYNTYDAAITTSGGGPSIATAAHAGSTNVTGSSTTLSVLGADAAGESTLTYTWTPVGRLPAPVGFSANGTNAAKNTTATFSKAGTYVFLVVAQDAAGLTTTSTVTVTVAATLTSIAVSPASPNMVPSATQQFTAVANDQFGNPLASQPTFTWTASTGSITSSGLYTAPIADAAATITAKSGSISGTATATVAVVGTVVLTVNPGQPVTSTNFQTIQSAIDSIPAANITPYDIQVSPGTYAERIIIPTGKEFITLDGRGGTVTIQMGADLTHVAIVQAQANNFTMENITVNDTSGQNGPDNALLSTGDRQTYLNDSFLGYQDTLFANKSFARQYFKNCTISGSVDFIYGASTCIFDTCNITQRVGGTALTAPATPQTAYGLVFINSHLINGGSISAGSTALARAWNAPYGQSVYIDSNMDNMISNVGWTNFSSTPQYVSTERYDEYGSYGPGAAGYLASPSQRASQAVSLTATQAALYANTTTWVPNFANLFNGWNPTSLGGDAPVIYTGSNGVWETASNWNTAAVPSAGQPVYIRSGSVQVASTANIDSLTLGTSTGGATLTVTSAGSLSVGGALTTAGTSGSPTVVNDAGSLAVNSVSIGNTSDQLHIQNNAAFSLTQGWRGSWPAGTIYVEKGTLAATSVGAYASGPIIDTGNVAGSTGTWNLRSGDLYYTQNFNTGAGTSIINVTGGTLYGTYGMQFGSLATGGSVTLNLSSGDLEFFNPNFGAKSGTYVINQTGGSIQKDLINSAGSTGYDWLLGDASGANSTWNLSQSSGTSMVGVRDLYVGQKGTGKFSQSAGTVTINQEDSTQVTSHSGLRLGWGAGGNGTYEISGGSLTIANGGITNGYDPVSGSFGTGTFRVIGGAAGTINVTGNYSQSSHSLMDDHANASGLATIAITGNVSFASGAAVNLTADAGAAPGTYTLMSWTGSATGTPVLAAGVDTSRWSISMGAHALTATLLPLSTVNGTSGNDSIRLVRNGSLLDIYVNNPTIPAYEVPFASLGPLSVNGGGGNDTINVDFTGGASPVPSGGLSIDGGTGTTDALIVTGTTAADTASVDATTVTFNNSPITYSNVESIAINDGSGADVLTQAAQPGNAATLAFSGSGADTLNVNAGTYTLPTDASLSTPSLTINVTSAGAAVNFTTTQHLTALSLSSGGVATLTASASPATTPLVLNVGTMNISGSGSHVDLANNELLMNASSSDPLSMITAGQVSSALSGGALGYLAQGGSGGGEIRVTLLGDTNLDGTVNVADLANLAGNFGASTPATWVQGDFDFNQLVNVADLADLAGNFGQTIGGGTGTASPSAAQPAAAPAKTVEIPLAASPSAIPSDDGRNASAMTIFAVRDVIAELSFVPR